MEYTGIKINPETGIEGNMQMQICLSRTAVDLCKSQNTNMYLVRVTAEFIHKSFHEKLYELKYKNHMNAITQLV